jgi:adenine-specific DNA methylase
VVNDSSGFCDFFARGVGVVVVYFAKMDYLSLANASLMFSYIRSFNSNISTAGGSLALILLS